MFGASPRAKMKLVDKSKSTGKDRKKTLELVQRCNALADESKSLVRCRALLQGWEQERLRCCRGGRIGIVRPSVGREVLEGVQMIACCVWLVKAMLGEPGDALRLRELKAKGQNVEFPTKETEETRDPRGS